MQKRDTSSATALQDCAALPHPDRQLKGFRLLSQATGEALGQTVALKSLRNKIDEGSRLRGQ